MVLWGFVVYNARTHNIHAQCSLLTAPLIYNKPVRIIYVRVYRVFENNGIIALNIFEIDCAGLRLNAAAMDQKWVLHVPVHVIRN